MDKTESSSDHKKIDLKLAKSELLSELEKQIIKCSPTDIPNILQENVEQAGNNKLDITTFFDKNFQINNQPHSILEFAAFYGKFATIKYLQNHFDAKFSDAMQLNASLVQSEFTAVSAASAPTTSNALQMAFRSNCVEAVKAILALAEDPSIGYRYKDYQVLCELLLSKKKMLKEKIEGTVFYNEEQQMIQHCENKRQQILDKYNPRFFEECVSAGDVDLFLELRDKKNKYESMLATCIRNNAGKNFLLIAAAYPGDQRILFQDIVECLGIPRLALSQREELEAERTPLHVAAQAGNVRLVNYLASYYSCYAFDESGFLPLHCAISSDQISLHEKNIIINEFISNGIDINALTQCGKSSVDIAFEMYQSKEESPNKRQSDYQLIRALLFRGARPHLETWNNISKVLVTDVIAQDDTEILNYLKSVNAKFISEFRTDNRNNGAHLAVEKQARNVQIFLAVHYRELFHKTNDHGDVPLSILLRKEMEDINELTKNSSFVWVSNPQQEQHIELIRKLINPANNDHQEARARNLQEDLPAEEIKYLAVKGGGPKGLAYPAALMKLMEEKVIDWNNIEELAGTSAGAIFVGLLSVGYTPEELENIIVGMDFMSFIDPEYFKNYVNDYFTKNELPGMFSILYQAAASSDLKNFIMQGTGFCKGKNFRAWIDEKITTKFRELSLNNNIENITFGELHAYVQTYGYGKFKDPTFYAVNANTKQLVEFNYIKTPDDCIADAIRCSMSIPLLYQPSKRWIKDEKGRRVEHPDGCNYMDGGLRMNYPLRFKDTKDKLNPHTLGLCLVTPPEFKHYRCNAAPGEEEINNLFKVLNVVLSAAMQEQTYPDDENIDRSVLIKTDGSMFEFFMSDDRKQQYTRFGIEGVMDFIQRRGLSNPYKGLNQETLEVICQYAKINNVHINGNIKLSLISSEQRFTAEQVFWIYAVAKENEILTLRRFINPNVEDEQGFTPLDFASYYEHDDIKKETQEKLLAANANPAKRNDLSLASLSFVEKRPRLILEIAQLQREEDYKDEMIKICEDCLMKFEQNKKELEKIKKILNSKINELTREKNTAEEDKELLVEQIEQLKYHNRALKKEYEEVTANFQRLLDNQTKNSNAKQSFAQADFGNSNQNTTTAVSPGSFFSTSPSVPHGSDRSTNKTVKKSALVKPAIKDPRSLPSPTDRNSISRFSKLGARKNLAGVTALASNQYNPAKKEKKEEAVNQISKAIEKTLTEYNQTWSVNKSSYRALRDIADTIETDSCLKDVVSKLEKFFKQGSGQWRAGKKDETGQNYKSGYGPSIKPLLMKFLLTMPLFNREVNDDRLELVTLELAHGLRYVLHLTKDGFDNSSQAGLFEFFKNECKRFAGLGKAVVEEIGSTDEVNQYSVGVR